MKRRLTWFEMLDMVSFNHSRSRLFYYRKYSEKADYTDILEFLDYCHNHPIFKFTKLGMPINRLCSVANKYIGQTIAFSIWYFVANSALKFFSTFPFYIHYFIDDESINALANYVANGYIQHSYRLNKLQSVIAWVKRLVGGRNDN